MRAIQVQRLHMIVLPSLVHRIAILRHVFWKSRVDCEGCPIVWPGESQRDEVYRKTDVSPHLTTTPGFDTLHTTVYSRLASCLLLSTVPLTGLAMNFFTIPLHFCAH